MKKILKNIGAIALYALLVTGVLYGLAWVGAAWKSYAILDAFFILSLLAMFLGVAMSIRGNATGSRMYSGESPAEMMADLEALKIERNLTNYYDNFLKQLVPDLSKLRVSLILAGLLGIIGSWFLG